MTVIIDSTAVINAVRLAEQAGDPAAPAASFWLLYAKAGGLYIEDSSSVVTGPFGTGGSGSDAPTVAVTLTNKDGAGVVQGDVVIIADFDAGAFYTLAGQPYSTSYYFGVVLDASIANNATGKIIVSGYVPLINLDASANLGDRIAVSTTNKQGTPHPFSSGGVGEFMPGDFGMVLGTGTTPAAIIWGPPVPPTERLLASVPFVNLNTGSSQDLYTVPTGRSCVVTKVVIRAASISLTTVSFSLGFNSTSFNDVVANATHTELTSSALYTVLVAKIGATAGVAGDTFSLKNNTNQGSAATCTVDVFGYLF